MTRPSLRESDVSTPTYRPVFFSRDLGLKNQINKLSDLNHPTFVDHRSRWIITALDNPGNFGDPDPATHLQLSDIGRSLFEPDLTSSHYLDHEGICISVAGSIKSDFVVLI